MSPCPFQDLLERLWDISNNRKEENEQERAAVMQDRWLVDHTALIINYHSILLQVRFLIAFTCLTVEYTTNHREPDLFLVVANQLLIL